MSAKKRLETATKQHQITTKLKKIATVLYFVFITASLLLVKNYDGAMDAPTTVCFYIAISELVIMTILKVIDLFLLERIKHCKEILKLKKSLTVIVSE